MRALPELGWRLAGGWPVPPRWEKTRNQPPPVAIHEAPDALQGALALLEERLDGKHPWRLDVLRLPQGDAAVAYQVLRAYLGNGG